METGDLDHREGRHYILLASEKDPCNPQNILWCHQVLSALLVALGYREEI